MRRMEMLEKIIYTEVIELDLEEGEDNVTAEKNGDFEAARSFVSMSKNDERQNEITTTFTVAKPRT